MDNSITRIRVAGHRPALVATAAFSVLALVCVAGLLVDPRLLGGQPIWAKPLKFALSFALYLGTFALLVPLVRGRVAGRVARLAATLTVAASAVEIALIVLQAVRGRASHFNTATPFDTAVYGTMGAAAAAIWVLTAVLAVTLLRQRSLPPARYRAIGLGMLVSLVGMAVAFLMVLPTGAQLADPAAAQMLGAHAVGVADGGPGLPLFGWSTTGGDLRVGHFVGLHALQGLPLLAVGLEVLSGRVRRLRDERLRARLVTIAAAAWLGTTALLTVDALRGRSVVAPDALTLAGGTVLLAGTAVAAAVVVVRAVRPGVVLAPAVAATAAPGRP